MSDLGISIINHVLGHGLEGPALALASMVKSLALVLASYYVFLTTTLPMNLHLSSVLIYIFTYLQQRNVGAVRVTHRLAACTFHQLPSHIE